MHRVMKTSGYFAYGEVAPKWIEDLATYKDLDPNTREIKCGAFSFLCGKDALFAGVVEIIYPNALYALPWGANSDARCSPL
jgi:hypothetical protein